MVGMGGKGMGAEGKGMEGDEREEREDISHACILQDAGWVIFAKRNALYLLCI